MLLRRTLSKPTKMMVYAMVVLAAGLIPSDYPYYRMRYVPIWQSAFHHWGGWTWFTVGSLFWFLFPPLLLIACYRRNAQTLTVGKQIGFSIGWSILCAFSGEITDALLYALLMFGFIFALWSKEAL